MSETKQAERILTTITGRVEKKVLVWLAERMPGWVTSDMLTIVGSLGAFCTGLGFFMTNHGINWLWLSIVGLAVNWFGDSLDGTLARVRNTQRPIYGYYIDHTVDCVNEAFMFIGAGLSPLLHLDLAMAAFILYLFMTINVSINAHLKSEFRLTYAKLGPTEFRLIIMIVCLALIFIPSLCAYGLTIRDEVFSLLDIVAMVIVIFLTVIYLETIVNDARHYAKVDPLKKK